MSQTLGQTIVQGQAARRASSPLKHFLRGLAVSASVLFVGFSAVAQAQTFPTKPITVVVPSTAGSSIDTLMRAFGQEITRETGQAVIVSNKPGAGTIVATQAVASAAPDGYTVLVGSSTSHAINPHLFKKLPYDPIEDFEPVGMLARIPQLLFVNPVTVPAKSMEELVKFAKQQPPGKLTLVDSTSSVRMLSVQLEQLSGMKLTTVGYKSFAEALPDLIAGRVDMAFGDVGFLQHVRDGKLRALGVTSIQRSTFVPDLPTLDEGGVKGFDKTLWIALYVPAKTPAPVISRLHELFAKASGKPELQKAYASYGADVAITTPQDLAKFQAAERESWGRLAKSAGIEPQ